MIDITELPAEQLTKSRTWRRFYDAEGICDRCLNHTSLLHPCCGTSVRYKNSFMNYESIWNDIEDELKEFAYNEAHSDPT